MAFVPHCAIGEVFVRETFVSAESAEGSHRSALTRVVRPSEARLVSKLLRQTRLREVWKHVAALRACSGIQKNIPE